jgi:demethylmenaquinone methyltransferase/2-methoxy-6-polyprenyl-1,4-benzoquinol methylase
LRWPGEAPVAEADELVAAQIAYYRARAEEYDRMLARERRYDIDGLDPTAEDEDTRELAMVETALREFNPTGDVLELACGPGWWTKRLARSATSLTAVDASPEMLAVNRSRVPSPAVELVQSDLFEWVPGRQYDVVFFSFWLSHVPRDRFTEFWGIVGRALKPGGRVFLLDERDADALDGHEVLLADERGAALRWLEDGRRFRMVKVYYQPDELEALLAAEHWSAEVTAVGRRLYYGVATRLD